jgi:hypothetical protein
MTFESIDADHGRCFFALHRRKALCLALATSAVPMGRQTQDLVFIQLPTMVTMAHLHAVHRMNRI